MKIGNFPRKRYLIDNVQYRLLGVSMLYFCAIVLVFAGTLFIPIIIELNSGTLASPAVQETANQFLLLHTKFWLPALLLISLLVMHMTVVSHRIVGPLYRFRDELRKIGDGNLFVHVKLRQNDYLTKEADSINKMVEALRSKVRDIEVDQRLAQKLLVELQRAVIRGSADDVNDKIDEMTGVIENLQKNVEKFQIPRTTTRAPEKPVKKADPPQSQKVPAGAGAAGEK